MLLFVSFYCVNYVFASIVKISTYIAKCEDWYWFNFNWLNNSKVYCMTTTKICRKKAFEFGDFGEHLWRDNNIPNNSYPVERWLKQHCRAIYLHSKDLFTMFDLPHLELNVWKCKLQCDTVLQPFCRFGALVYGLVLRPLLAISIQNLILFSECIEWTCSPLDLLRVIAKIVNCVSAYLVRR